MIERPGSAGAWSTLLSKITFLPVYQENSTMKTAGHGCRRADCERFRVQYVSVVNFGYTCPDLSKRFGIEVVLPQFRVLEVGGGRLTWL